MVKVEANGTETSQINRYVPILLGMGFSRVLGADNLEALPILVLVPLLMHLNLWKLAISPLAFGLGPNIVWSFASDQGS